MNRSDLQLSQALGHDVTDKRIKLLRQVGRVGSISEAARVAGVSYKAAWQALETLSNLAGQALVEKAVGGSGGGGAQLTPAGLRLLEAADLFAQARATVLSSLGKAAPEGPGAAGLLGLGLRTSMRNQLPCTVRALQPLGDMLRVELALAAGSALHARITSESAELLGLRTGLPVMALCKATAVEMARSVVVGEGRNGLGGVLRRVSASPLRSEVVLEIEPGLCLVGFAPAALALQPGERAMAAVDEAAIVLAA